MVKKREVEVGEDDDNVATVSGLFIPKVVSISPIKGGSVSTPNDSAHEYTVMDRGDPS